jgi:hypothetical protein
MRVPILSGVYTDSASDFRVSYPVNMLVVPGSNGVDNSYLRPADGLVSVGTGPGVDRGGIEWQGQHYRVMGPSLVRISSAGVVTVLGSVGGTTGLVTFDYSFDRLAIASNNNLFYWNGTSLQQVLDPDLGTVVDAVWVDGYFMTTDGTSLVVTELLDPTSVNPLKYGSSEVDPDSVVALLKLRNEVYALNRHTIEVFDNIGGDFFPFQRIDGAQIPKGCIGTHACCVYEGAVAFLGGGRNEAPSIYIGANGQARQISTQEIDRLLMSYTEAQLAAVKMEARNDKAQRLLYVHLPDRTLVFDAAASAALDAQVWTVLTSTLGASFSQYKARNFTWVYDKWWVGDPGSTTFGTLAQTIGTHWGAHVRWEFGTVILYNGGKGAIIHQLELVALTGRVASGLDPTLSTSYSVDGMTWSQSKFIKAGGLGDRTKRLAWFQQGHMRNMRMQRFQGDTQTHLAITRLEAQIEALAN